MYVYLSTQQNTLKCLYVKDTILLKQKKRLVLDITGFVFKMSSQVKVDVRNSIYVLYVLREEISYSPYWLITLDYQHIYIYI